MKVAVGSTNPVKIEAVKDAFKKVWSEKKWEVVGFAIPSGVSSQPKSDLESIKGATNRARGAFKKTKADYAVGLEGGLSKINNLWFDTAWIVILNKKEEQGIDIKEYIKNIIPQLRLASSRLGKEMGMRMSYPYIYEEVLDFAQTLDPEDNLALLDLGPGDFTQLQAPEQGNINVWGKIPLRNAAYGLLPNEIIWRIKTDLQFGSGFGNLENYLEATVTLDEAEELRQSGKHFWNKYHGKLYLMYKDLGLEPTKPGEGEYGCPWCRGGVPQGRGHCHTCGYNKSVGEMTKTFFKEYPEDQN